MVSMGFLEPSTGRAGRAKREPPQFNSLTAGEESLGGAKHSIRHGNQTQQGFYPHEFTVQESLWKACPRTFLHFPPSGEGHADHNSRLVRRPPSPRQRPPTEKQREGLWRER